MAFWQSPKWVIIREKIICFPFTFGIVNEYPFRKIVCGDSENSLLYSFQCDRNENESMKTRQYELDSIFYCS